MTRTTLNLLSALAVGCALIAARQAQAAPLTWDINPALSSLSLGISDQPFTFGTISGTARIRNQNGGNSGPWNTGNTAAIDGTIATNYVDGASIEFLSAGSDIFGINSANYRPNPAVWDGENYTDNSTASGVFGARVRASVSIVTVDAGFLSLRNVDYGVTSGVLPVSSGNFDASGATVGIDSAQIAFQGLSILTTTIPSALGTIGPFGSVNGGGDGAIVSPDPIGQPNLRRLLLPIAISIQLDASGVTVNGTATGTIVADAIVPEPGGLVLALGVAVAGCPLIRRLVRGNQDDSRHLARAMFMQSKALGWSRDQLVKHLSAGRFLQSIIKSMHEPF